MLERSAVLRLLSFLSIVRITCAFCGLWIVTTRLLLLWLLWIVMTTRLLLLWLLRIAQTPLLRVDCAATEAL